jgi:hypothetical protein
MRIPNRSATTRRTYERVLGDLVADPEVFTLTWLLGSFWFVIS